MARVVVPSNVQILGVYGRIGAGKDYFASLVSQVAEQNGYFVVRRAMGDALKGEVSQFLARFCRDHALFRDCYGENERRELILECLHGESRPEKEQFRLLMQWWGTEYRRASQGPDYWCEQFVQWLGKYPFERFGRCLVTVPDLRFRNEADCIHELGGQAVWITSPYETAGDHSSENDLAGGYVSGPHFHRQDNTRFEHEVKQWATERFPPIQFPKG